VTADEVQSPTGGQDPVSTPVVYTDEKFTYQEGWRWGKSLRRWFHRELSSITDPPQRPVLHVCCGESTLGDIRADIVPGCGNVRADAFNLPFADGSIPTIVSDPPYDWAIQHRMGFFQELARVHQPGGLLLHKAPWGPLDGFYQVKSVYEARNRHLPRDVHRLTRSRRREGDADPEERNDTLQPLTEPSTQQQRITEVAQ
jgi:SAM-dependent methyltransferase